MLKNKKIILFAVFLIGFFLRFYSLGNVPSSLHRDEAFLGYNAYSILKTGRDMTGNFFPLHFKSFIYSPAGYSYFSIIPIYIFGLSAFSTRFASAFFGNLTVLVCYFLCAELLNDNKKKYLIAIFSSLMLAISPWNINLSRTATENTIAVFFISLGVYWFLVWLRRNQDRFLLSSIISFGITLFIYQAPRAFLPIFIPVLVLIYLRKNRYGLFISLLGLHPHLSHL